MLDIVSRRVSSRVTKHFLPAPILVLVGLLVTGSSLAGERQRETLGRGVVAFPGPDGGTVVGWRLLVSDPAEVVFHVYRRDDGSKSNPCLCADIFGDRREEIVAATRDGRELRIFSSTIPTDTRRVTLMHDPVYRLSVAWQNVSFDQPAHLGFFLDDDGGAAAGRSDAPPVNVSGRGPIPNVPIRFE